MTEVRITGPDDELGHRRGAAVNRYEVIITATVEAASSADAITFLLQPLAGHDRINITTVDNAVRLGEEQP